MRNNIDLFNLTHVSKWKQVLAIAVIINLHIQFITCTAKYFKTIRYVEHDLQSYLNEIIYINTNYFVEWRVGI